MAGVIGGFIVFICAYFIMLFMIWYFYERSGSPLSISRV